MKLSNPVRNGTALLVGAFVAAFIHSAWSTRARADTSAACFVGGSVGTTAALQRVSGGDARLDLGTHAIQAGPEIGCNLKLTGFTFGGLLRYDFLDTKIAVDSMTLKNNGRWMALGKLGFDINPSTNVYGVLGMAGSRWTFDELGSTTNRGWVVGGGADLDIGKSGAGLFVEYNAILNRARLFDETSIRATEHVIRTGIRFKLGQ